MVLLFIFYISSKFFKMSSRPYLSKLLESSVFKCEKEALFGDKTLSVVKVLAQPQVQFHSMTFRRLCLSLQLHWDLNFLSAVTYVSLQFLSILLHSYIIIIINFL